jgi:hypothetical protein
MKRLFVSSIVICGLLALVGPALSASVVNTAGDGFEDRSNGSVFGYYQNSGNLLFTQSGNNNDLSQVQSYLNAVPVYSGATLTLADVIFTSYDGNSGTWAVSAPTNGAIDFYSVKAGNYWAMYAVNPSGGAGSWSTYDIWAIGGPGTGGHPNNGSGSLTISHFTGYNPSTSVPEPATLALLGFGLIGVGVTAKRRVKK